MEALALSPEYQAIMDEFKITRINTVGDLDKIFSVDSLHENIQKINIESGFAYIMFDTPVYNSAYILDEYAKFRRELVWGVIVDEKLVKISDNVHTFYCDSKQLHKDLLAPFLVGHNVTTETPPCCIMVCKDADSIFIEVERLEIISSAIIVKNHCMMADAKEATRAIVGKSNEKEIRRQIENFGNKNIN